MNDFLEIISRMAPEEALSQITLILERLLVDLDTDARKRFLMNLIGRSENDKVASLVHL